MARRADAIACVSEAIAAETEALGPRGRVVTIANGSDFDDFAGIEYTRGERFRITHTGSFFGKRDPRPFLTALEAAGSRTSSRASSATSAPADRDWLEGRGLAPIGSSSIPYVPRRRSLELQRDSEALLLLIPEAGGRGKGVLSGKVFEYLAAERPILARRPARRCCRGPAPRPGSGPVVAPEDVAGLRRRAPSTCTDAGATGTLEPPALTAEQRDRVDRQARVRELAELMRSVV